MLTARRGQLCARLELLRTAHNQLQSGRIDVGRSLHRIQDGGHPILDGNIGPGSGPPLQVWGCS